MNTALSTPKNASLSDVKRKLLGEFLRGRVLQARVNPSSICKRAPSVPVPLSLAQEQIWSVLEANPGAPPLFNEFITIHRQGPMNVAALQRSLTDIVRRHEAWRTTFHCRDGRPIQVIAPSPESVPLAIVDLRDSPQADRPHEAALVAAIEARVPFDLAKGPLFRATLIHLDDQEHRIHFAFHQLIVDGFSVFEILPTELIALYDNFVGGKPASLEELPIQFGDFACWQREWLGEDALNRQLAYWKTQLAGCPTALDWPKGGLRPAAQTFRGAIYPKLITSNLAKALRDRSQRQGASLFMTLLAGLAALLHLYSQQEDIVIGTLTSSGRDRSELRNLLGYFMNPLPLRLRLQDNPTFHQLLSQAREVTSGALANDDVPLHYLSQALQPVPDPSRHPFFQVAVSLAPELPDLGPGWDQTFMDFESGAARWDLYLEFNDRPTGLMLRAQYNPDIFSPGIIGKAVLDLEALLDAATSDPSLRISELRMCLS